MTRLILIFFALLILYGCSGNCDFTISKAYREFLFEYHKGDTIFFRSNTGDLDTLLISSYDTTEHCGSGIMAYRRKDFRTGIQHLPSNNWIGGREGNNELNQDLFVLEKSFRSNPDSGCFIYVSYRDFEGELENISSIKHNDSLSHLGVSEYWQIKKSNYDSRNGAPIPDDKIHSVIWTKEFGLTRYEYGNGEVYTIMK
ncbi:hypothetical protein [Reichenbachiella ulvae]|uniref:Lipoprotein n=1 Tax=Reichenbachiella ulvae TaxID=2980104 RepID=A0ABT3CQ11_9BACT|nr:hypothetical protein [Reichenbachiella ulvae]MCV9385363.1 hypothetical protein [Reichenbachiella ulvae]